MASRDEIVAHCDALLDASSFEDWGPNGLQVPGQPDVSKLASGVSANLELLSRAAEAGAQLVLAHHGLFWDSHPLALSEQMAERLRVVLGHRISVAAYHLPLDAHREIGNNALLCRGLELQPQEGPFGVTKGRPIGIVGLAPAGMPVTELTGRIERLLRREPLVFDAGPERIRRVGIVSGAGSDSLAEAVSLGLDAFITGEPTERAMGEAREGGIHYLAAGHYATETLGVRRLGEMLAERFALEHEFIDVPNPV